MQATLDSAVLMRSREPVAGYHHDGPDQFQALGDSIKSYGTMIDAVPIDPGGAGQSAALPCASPTSNVFKLTQPSQIATAFSRSSTQISKLRVAR